MQRRRVVMITGATAGVGRALAHEFAGQGAAVGLIARDGEALDLVLAEVRDRGGEGLALVADVARYDQLERAAARVERELGPIEVWVNNAMVTVFGPVQSVPPDEFRQVTEVTYLGYVYGTKIALSHMAPRDRGVIIQVGSALAYRSIPLQAAYCGAKAAIRGFTDSLRSELLHDRSRVRLTMVQLPAVNTPQFDWARDHMPRLPRPVAPVYQPEAIARSIAWVADHPRREMLLGYMTLAAVWANKFIPGWLDVYLARTNYEAQQRREKTQPQRRSDIFAPVGPLHRTRGSFDREAKSGSWQFWAARHKASAVTLAAVAAAVGVAALARRPFDET